MLRWIETEDKNWNELLLLNGIGNRFHRTCFYFTGNGSKMDGYRMYMGLDRILGNIGC